MDWKTAGKGYIINTLDSILDVEREAILDKFNRWPHLNWDIIVDAYNVNPQRVREFEKLANETGAELIIHDIYVPYLVSYKRNKEVGVRSKEYIPRDVITTFYDMFYHERYRDELTDKRTIRQPELTLPSCVICDLDATLALHQGREPFEWSLLKTDKIDPRLRLLLNNFMGLYKVLFVTGRPESARQATTEWLKDPENKLHSNWELFMRKNNDFSHGDDYKEKVYHENIEGKYNVLCVFEDSNKCVTRWRELGLLTCQVANSDF
jgi:hypothetical protein